MMDEKPRRVKAKISRSIEEVAIVLLDRDGNIDEVEYVTKVLDDSTEVCDIMEVRSFHVPFQDCDSFAGLVPLILKGAIKKLRRLPLQK